MPESGGATLTITGTNFGYKSESAQARVGPTFCLTSTWLTETSVTCQTPPAGDRQLAGLDVAISVGQMDRQTGALAEVANYEGEVATNAFDTCPCPEYDEDGNVILVQASVAELSCGPDRDETYSGLSFYQWQEAGLSRVEIDAQNGATRGLSDDGQVTTGISIGATGSAESREKLFAIQLDNFLSDATYALTVALSGDYTVAAGGLPQDIIIGLGNTEQFYGVVKQDWTETNQFSFVKGRYATDTLIGGQVLTPCEDPSSAASCQGSQANLVTAMRTGQSWDPLQKPTATPDTVIVRFAAYKNANNGIDLTLDAKQLWTNAGGIRVESPRAQNVISGFNLPGKELPYEVVVFRRYQQQTFLVKQVDIDLCGCNPGGSTLNCVTSIDGNPFNVVQS